MDASIDGGSGEVEVKSMDDGKENVQKDHLKLPPDLANGLVLILLKNVGPGSPEIKLSYMAATPKPKLVKLNITSDGEEAFTTAGVKQRAIHYVVKVELGGITGVVAPLIGKQPQDVYVWILKGTVLPGWSHLES